jgi:hypothetical protein
MTIRIETVSIILQNILWLAHDLSKKEARVLRPHDPFCFVWIQNFILFSISTIGQTTPVPAIFLVIS